MIEKIEMIIEIIDNKEIIEVIDSMIEKIIEVTDSNIIIRNNITIRIIIRSNIIEKREIMMEKSMIIEIDTSRETINREETIIKAKITRRIITIKDNIITIIEVIINNLYINYLSICMFISI